MKTFKIIPSCILPYSPFGQVGEPLCEMGVFNMKNSKEVWRNVVGYDNHYIISNFGRLKSIKYLVSTNKRKNLLLKVKTDRYGYHTVQLILNKARKHPTIHRLVAQAFLPNPENKPQVNHKDGNKLNNHVDNLEWCTNQDNIIHAWKNKLIMKREGSENDKSQTFYMLGSNNNVIRTFGSISEAERDLAVDRKTITKAAKVNKKAYGVYWKIDKN